MGARAGPQATDLRRRWRAAARVSEDDSAWFGKAKSVGIRQVFMPDVLPTTLVALFVACCSTCIFGTVGGWMPLYLATEKHWSTAEYSLFYVFWGISGFFGLCVAGWLADKIGRRLAFIVTLIEGAMFMTLWVYTESHILLWMFGLAWSFGFLGFWGPSTTLTAEVFPTRIRGAANGVVWAIAYFVGFVLFPFVTVALQQHTGSFALSFLCIPVLMIAMAIGRDDDGARAFRQGAERDHRVRWHGDGCRVGIGALATVPTIRSRDKRIVVGTLRFARPDEFADSRGT